MRTAVAPAGTVMVSGVPSVASGVPSFQVSAAPARSVTRVTSSARVSRSSVVVADGGAWFSVFTPAACEGLPAGASLVRVEGSQVTKFPDAGLGGSSLRLASRNLHVWLASEAVGGGFELRSFDVSGDTAVSDFERPLGLTHPGDWTQVDVTADGQGRPYVVGNSNAGVRVASFELDGGERFVLPVPATVGVRAVAAAWTSRGLAIAGDCDGADSGVCAPDAGNFLVLVRVPR